MVGYNIGAGRKDRARSIFTHMLTVEVLIGLTALIIVEIFPRQLIGIFGAANESIYYTQFAVRCFRTYLCMIILSTVNKGTTIFLQAIGKAVQSTLLALMREVVMGVSLPIILPMFFGLSGVLYSFPLADILTFIVTIFVIAMTLHELDPNDGRTPGEKGKEKATVKV